MKLKPSYLMAGVVALAVTGWMLSGNFLGTSGGASAPAANADAGQGQQTGPTNAAQTKAEERRFSVAAITVRNQPITRSIRASGVSEAKFNMTVSSKADGEIIAIDAVEGRAIKAGATLVRLETGTLVEQIAAAKANLEVARKRRDVTERLAKENFSAPLEQAERAAALANAVVTLRQLEDQLADRVIVAPVSGYLETLHVETGERVRRDTPVATILGLATLNIRVAVPQTEIAKIKTGSAVTVTIAGAGTRSGVVSKIAAQSNPATRTFDVTIDLANPDGTLRAGMSVEASISAGTLDAFAMSPAHLSVADDGSLTAKIAVDGKVVVVPVDIVRSGAEQVYVSGLPDNAVLLTVGQAFVGAGAPVRYRLASGS